ncbi:MAG: prepilin-type N-terminal cleavage/methylation domain-containing protein [Solirubrobacteraceae bacterium]
MRRRPTTHAGQQGFALVEVLIAAALLLVGMTGILTLVDSAASTTTTTRTREAGTALQRELIEGARSVPYEQMTPNALAGLVSQRPGLSDSSIGSSGWTINRRNAVYTVSVGVCSVDDPRDGIGSHEAGVFCRSATGASTAGCSAWLGAGADVTATGVTGTGSLTAGDCGIDADLDGVVEGLADVSASLCLLGSCGSPVDTAPADYKRVVSLVRWAGGGWNLQTSTVNSPGTAAAPAVRTLTAATTTVTSGTGLVFNAQVAPAPSTVSLLLEGRQVATASPAGGDAWTATWNLGAVSTADGAQPAEGETLDGSHLLSAKGFDQYGQFGATRSVTVLVNRRRPFAPVRVAAGRNGAAVEIEWSPAKERDLEGHRVYRQVPLGPRVQVCALAQRTTCRDSDPPATSLASYDVVGVDRDPAGALREGDRSSAVGVKLTNQPPPAPTNLTAALSSSNVVLSWSAPATADPDLGDAIDHYNIYRDGTSLADRIDRTDVAELSWTDTAKGGVQHDYYVTAVDGNLAESSILGPERR